MANNLFKCLDAINMKHKGYKYNKKDCSAYMLLMWLSHNKQCMPYVEIINQYLFDIPDNLVYDYLYKVIPKGKKFIRWDKGNKDKKLLKKEQSILQELQDDYQMSEFEAMFLYSMYIK